MKIYKTFIFLSLLCHIIGITSGIIETTDSIVAVVNDHAILDSDVRKKLEIIQYNFPINNKNLSKKSLSYQEMVNQLITKDLIFNIAKKENILADNNEINQTINNILYLRNLTLDQFQIYLKKINLNYEQFHSQLYQEITNNIICNQIVHQQAHISLDEINELIQILNTIDYNKQFKIIHVILPLSIQATQAQIKTTTNLAKFLIQNDNINNITKLINIQNSNNHVFQTIKMQKTTWVSWEKIPVVFDQYLQNIKTGNILGPIHSYDGIHILKIEDIRCNKFTFPIVKVKMKLLILKQPYKKSEEMQHLLRIKKSIENNDTTFNIIAKEISNNNNTMCYQEYLKWNNLDTFEPDIQKILINLNKNEISTPIRTSLGWCLIQLIDIKNINYSEMIRERAYYYLLNRKFNEVINDWIEELRSTSYIKIKTK